MEEKVMRKLMDVGIRDSIDRREAADINNSERSEAGHLGDPAVTK